MKSKKKNIFLILIILLIFLLIILLFLNFNSKNNFFLNEQFQDYQTNDDDILIYGDSTKQNSLSLSNPVTNTLESDFGITSSYGDKSDSSEEKILPGKPSDSLYAKNSFCQLDNSKTKCVCKFQKDDVKSAFNSPQVNCDKICSSIPLEQCLENNEFTEIPYYCNQDGKCVEYKGTIISSHISANNCGTESLTNQLLLPYSSLEECQKTIEPCNKLNDPSKSSQYNKTKCLENKNCGYCTNSSGQGKCISGNASGPNDLEKYFYCNPYNGSTNNVYEYGPQISYILPK
jgi:hypothetical protein